MKSSILNRMIFSIASAVCIFFTTSCGTADKKNEESLSAPEPEQNKSQKLFEQADKLLSEGRYSEAREIYLKLSKEGSNNEMSIVSLYNIGATWMGEKNCINAIESFRKVVRLSVKNNKRLAAESLLQLSYAYECIGKPSHQIASLKDAYKLKKFLSKEVATAELPARLAAAYASIGEKKEAERYFKLAQEGLLSAHHDPSDPVRRKLLLGKTLYFMGKLNLNDSAKFNNPKVFITSINYLQGYLLKSVEMDSRDWSLKSAENLKEAYAGVWDILDTPPQSILKIPDVEKRNITIRKWKTEILELTNLSLKKLKNLRFPDPNENDLVKALFLEVEKQERKVEIALSDLIVTNTLSKEALKREGLKRKGKVVSKPTVLEKKSSTQGKSLPDKKNKGASN